MPNLDELTRAFIAADSAGNHEDAQAFATEIKRMRAVNQGPLKPGPFAALADQQRQGFRVYRQKAADGTLAPAPPINPFLAKGKRKSSTFSPLGAVADTFEYLGKGLNYGGAMR